MKEKFDLSVRYTLMILIGVTFLISLFSFYNATKWIGKTFPGFLLYNPVIISDISLAHWAQNKDYGIKSYDKILEVNNIKVKNSKEVYSLVSKYEPETKINYKVLRNGNKLEFDIPSYIFTFFDFQRVFLIEFIVGFIFIVIGSIVFMLRQELLVSKVFLFVCLSIGWWFTLDFNFQSAYFPFYNVNFSLLGQLLAPTFVIWLAFVFPYYFDSYRKYQYFYLFPLLVSLAFFITHYFIFDFQKSWGLFLSISYLYCILGATILLFSLIKKYKYSENLTDKYKSLVVLYGSLFGFILPALIALYIVVFKHGSLIYATYPVILFPLSIAYSIVKHKLFDIDLIMQRTVLYGGTTAILAGVFIGVVYGLNAVLSEKINWQSPVLVFVFCGLMVVALNPLRDKIQSVVDKMFFRNKYDYRTVVSGVSKKLTTILNIDLIAGTVVNSINMSMSLEHAELIILNKKSGHYDSYSPGADPQKPANLKRSILFNKNRIITFLEGDTREIFKEDLFSEAVFIGKKQELLKEFEDLKASLIIPVAIKESMLGFLCLGNKRSGQPFNSIDLSLLQTLSNQAAIAIENSYALKLVESYSDEIEKKNVHLRDVQSQLVHAEKMSSIGHLASGIAHEIRNPLNIIEGARYYLANHLDSGTSKDSVAKEYLEYIANEIQRTNKLIDELLLFSKPTNSEISRVNFNSLVENILILTRKQVNDHSVTIEKLFDPDLPEVYADSNQIWQVFVNMLINSLESMNSNGHLLIKTGVNRDFNELNKRVDYAYIIFQDNGQGIKDECIEKIFDPFFTTKASGTGLGLSVGYKIVNSHNGRMLVNSEYGKGTKFMVEIPIDSTNIN